MSSPSRVSLSQNRRVTTQQEETERALTGAAPAFRRVLLKLSGEALMGEHDFGTDPKTIEAIAREIVEGMLAKRFYAAQPGGALTEQPWIHDSAKTVGQALSEAGTRVVAFTRFSVAE